MGVRSYYVSKILKKQTHTCPKLETTERISPVVKRSTTLIGDLI